MEVFYFDQNFTEIVPKGLIKNYQVLGQIMAWYRRGDKPLFEPIMVQFTDAYMHHSAWLSWWGWVMHLCLCKLNIILFQIWLVAWSTPSHYLNQCWNIANWTLRNKLQWNLNRNSYIFIQENAFENVFWKMAAILSWPQCVKLIQLQLLYSSYSIIHRKYAWFAHAFFAYSYDYFFSS